MSADGLQRELRLLEQARNPYDDIKDEQILTQLVSNSFHIYFKKPFPYLERFRNWREVSHTIALSGKHVVEPRFHWGFMCTDIIEDLVIAIENQKFRLFKRISCSVLGRFEIGQGDFPI